jgi:hypothetical protein
MSQPVPMRTRKLDEVLGTSSSAVMAALRRRRSCGGRQNQATHPARKVGGDWPYAPSGAVTRTAVTLWFPTMADAEAYAVQVSLLHLSSDEFDPSVLHGAVRLFTALRLDGRRL